MTKRTIAALLAGTLVFMTAGATLAADITSAAEEETLDLSEDVVLPADLIDDSPETDGQGQTVSAEQDPLEVLQPVGSNENVQEETIETEKNDTAESDIADDHTVKDFVAESTAEMDAAEAHLTENEPEAAKSEKLSISDIEEGGNKEAVIAEEAVEDMVIEEAVIEEAEEEEENLLTNTDTDDGIIDGTFVFFDDDDGYTYDGESYLDWNYPVAARLYQVTTPSPGRLKIDARKISSQTIPMEILVVKTGSEEYPKATWGEDGDVILGTFSKTTDILPAGTYTVIFSYCHASTTETILHDYSQKEYFYHGITWQKVDKVPVTGVKLNKTSQTLAVGKTAALKATVSPSYATNKKVTWSSSNTAVATVNANGTVTAKKAGTATITVTTADQKKKATCKITVTQPVTGVKLNKTKLIMGNGQSFTLKATVSPSNATNKKVTWKSSNTKLAKVSSSGKVTTAASANGTVKITATTADGAKAAACTITIRKPSVSYRTHVQTYGWQGWKKDGAMSGTSGQAKRLEGINIKLSNLPYAGSIVYRTHVQTYGWQGWRKDGAMSGTSGQAKRLEGIQIYLTGELSKHYDVYYRVHAQTYGWLGYAKNGVMAGTSGLAKRLEGINIWLVPKGGKAPGSTVRPYVVGGGGKLPDNPYGK